ncbi:hypothetical protein B0T19DRAFT_439392 [Cercophora scortea]|uniref:C2H2-type domain-containing protein n=1 Tax=Cercophora scortea TaxID=314031 RepID=A0AAE0MHD4_9PEZI|nr:hypothetical protein B0T19DRAFT_439392 [Cercophora scortea]
MDPTLELDAATIEFALQEQTTLKSESSTGLSDDGPTKSQPPPPSSARSSIASFASKSSVASNRYSTASSRLSSASMIASSVLEDAAWAFKLPVLPQPQPGLPPVQGLPPVIHQLKMYCCLSCDTKFMRKFDWKRHEIEFHEKESCYPCPEPECDKVFFQAPTFNTHHRSQHGCITCPHSGTVFKTLRKRTGRGCGFCGGFYSSLTRYFDHVAQHFEDNATKDMWQHSLVLYGLLHSQRLHDAWRRAITALPSGFRLEWNVKTSGRLDGYPELGSSLQDELEFFDGTTEEAEILVQKALGLARVIVPGSTEPVTGFRLHQLNAALPGHRVQTDPDGEFSSVPFETVECVRDPVDAGEEPRSSADDEQDRVELNAPCKKEGGSNSNSESECFYEDDSDSFDSADGFDGQDQTKSVAERAVQAMVDRVMSRFWTLLEQDSFMTDASEPRSSESSCSMSPQQLQSSEAKGRGNKARGAVSKRRRDDDVWDNDDNGEPSTPPHAPTKKPGRQTSPKFACPFRKHDPVKFSIHSHKICALTPWPSIARLKEHLYRSHKQPPYCKRCCETFPTSKELEQHMMVAAAEICAVQLREPPSGITPEHIERLRSKKKPARNYSDGERWQDIYKLLFPDVTDIPSPYFELLQDIGNLSQQSQDIMEYQAYLRAELPRLVRQCLEQEAQRQVQPLELALLESLPGIVQRCQETAFSAFQQEYTTVRAPRIEVIGEPLSAQIASAAPPQSGSLARQAPSDILDNTGTLAYDFAPTTQPSFDLQVTPTSVARPTSQMTGGSNQVPSATTSVSSMVVLPDDWQNVSLSGFEYLGPCTCVGPCTCMDTMLGGVSGYSTEPYWSLSKCFIE